MAPVVRNSSVDERYQQQVNSALESQYRQASKTPREIRLDRDRWILFSDVHMGTRDGKDDFQGSELAFLGALGYYWELGYHLAILGDDEELWENDVSPVLKEYQAVLELEGEFHKQGRFWKIWGNHDKDWEKKKFVNKNLNKFFPDIVVHENILLAVQERKNPLGRILLIHGHQGTTESDLLARFSRPLVRFGWSFFQNLTNISLNTPAKNWELRKNHNVALYNWAVQQEGLVLIAGHTHHPVFDPNLKLLYYERELDEARRKAKRGSKDIKLETANYRASMEFEKARDSRLGVNRMQQPCYFNTGCCCYSDGDITGIEIADGWIRLVRWPNDEGRPRPKVLAKALLKTEVFSRVAGKGEALAF